MVIRSRYVEALTVLMLTCLLAATGCFNFPDGPYRCESNADCDEAAGEWCDLDIGHCVTDEEVVVEELRLELEGEQNTQAEINSVLEIAVRVVNEKNEPVAGQQVEFELVGSPPESGDPHLVPLDSQTNAEGLATTTLKLGTKIGTYTVVAAAVDEHGKDLEGSPLTIDIVAVSRPPDELERVSGDAQMGEPGQELDLPFVLRLRDDHTNPLIGQRIDFTVNAPGGDDSYSFDPEGPVTNDDGEASVIFTLGQTIGRYEIIATATVGEISVATSFFAVACRQYPCPGGQRCNLQSGECEGSCCSGVACEAGEICDEELCLSSPSGVPEEDACVPNPCGTDCQEHEACDTSEETPVCRPRCIVEGCPEPYLRCDSESGLCEIRPPVEGEIGWPCGDFDSNSELCDSGLCGPFGLCTAVCNQNDDCGPGAVCRSEAGDNGSCVAACHPYWRDDCAAGTQCAQLPGLDGPACAIVFEISNCLSGCTPRGAPCNPTIADQCDRGLACVGHPGGDVGVCRQVQCHLPRSACERGDELCLPAQAETSFCVKKCRLDVFADCPAGLACVPGPHLVTLDQRWSFASAPDRCPPGHPNNVESDQGTICFVGCDGGCPDGMFCAEAQVGSEPGVTVRGCVHMHTVEADCSACQAPLDCASAGGNKSVCHVRCENDADCAAPEEMLGSCKRVPVGTEGSVQVCIYESQGAGCRFGCDSHKQCGYCLSDDDCGTFHTSQGNSVDLRCDMASSTCRRPTTEAQVPLRCHKGEARDPEGITNGDGTFQGACAIPCTDDLDCPGACRANKFCAPAGKTCNQLSGQCEALCSSETDCIHGACVGDKCQVGCLVAEGCEHPGECVTSNEGISYCLVPEMTIEELRIKRPAWEVTVEGIVTAKLKMVDGGILLFVQEENPRDFGGIELIGAPAHVHIGDRIWVTGRLHLFQGNDRLGDVSMVSVIESGIFPEPRAVSPPDIRDFPEEHQSLLLSVSDVTVSRTSVFDESANWEGDFVVEDTGGSELVIGRLFGKPYEPLVDDAFQSITGVLRFAADKWRLEPRIPRDLRFDNGAFPVCTLEYCGSLGQALFCDDVIGECVLGCTVEEDCDGEPIESCNSCPTPGACDGATGICDSVAHCPCDTMNCQDNFQYCDTILCECVPL